MKIHCFLVIVALLMAAMTGGCEYDVVQPQWDKPPTTTTEVTITGIEPAEAIPGVNYITIYGTNFTGAIDTAVIRNENVNTTFIYNGVYFDSVRAEVVECSSTSIKVRRPGLATDSCTVKVAPSMALIEGKFSPYKIYSVIERYGNFLENEVLSTVTVDQSENLYVTTATTNIYKVTPDGEKTIIGTSTRAPTDARIGPDGNLYLMETDRVIQKVDFAADTVASWTQLPSGKNVKFGDFDANGYFYTGGRRTDLLIVAFDLLTTTPVGLYATEEILAIRVYSGYVYVASKTSTQPPKIWKQAIGEGGTLSSRELVLDMSTTEFKDFTLTALAFSINGNIFIGIVPPNPTTQETPPDPRSLLIFDPITGQIDAFYKKILPPYCRQFAWGYENYLYVIIGNTSTIKLQSQDWTVYRLDMGMSGTP